MPTETYYGLAVDPFNPEAVERLFSIKQRPKDKPILVLISDIEQLSRVAAGVPETYKQLIDHYWPGPLTLIFPSKIGIPPRLTGGTGTVGVRYSSSEAALEICRRSGGIITATSANISGEPAATSAEAVKSSLGTGVDLIVDGGPAPASTGSTVVGLEQGRLQIYRQGALPLEL